MRLFAASKHRLTRALTDFAKIVEAFDARGIALVSVTRQY
jgi:DNA invertase Pin-like site-specific DNA recombinase